MFEMWKIDITGLLVCVCGVGKQPKLSVEITCRKKLVHISPHTTHRCWGGGFSTDTAMGVIAINHIRLIDRCSSIFEPYFSRATIQMLILTSITSGHSYDVTQSMQKHPTSPNIEKDPR